MALTPLHDRILVRQTDEEIRSTGGIIIPDTAQEKPGQGIVVAVGAGLRISDGTIAKMSLSKGDNILFGKFSGNEVVVDGEELMIMRESDVMAVLGGKKKAKAKSKKKK